MLLAACLLAAPTLLMAASASARQRGTPTTEESEARTKGKGDDASSAKSKGGKTADGKGKPVQVGSFGDWGAYTAQGKGKTCYALAKPKERSPASLKRDDAYMFISNRPADHVRNEVSIIMGFAMKDNGEAKAEIGSAKFDLVAKGPNAWVKDPAKEAEFVESLKKGKKLVIRAASLKGSTTTDSYSLAGFPDALARVQKECQ